MIFLEEIRELTNSSGWCIRERRDIVYLTPTAQDQSKKEEKPKEASAEKKPAPEPKKGDFEVVVKPDEVMLFRFSALTFNSHRIHYDQPYVTKVEGYKGGFGRSGDEGVKRKLTVIPIYRLSIVIYVPKPHYNQAS